MPTYRRLSSFLLVVALTGIAVGGVASAILDATGEWNAGKFLGRFQQGVLVSAMLAGTVTAVEAGRIRRQAADPGSAPKHLPRSAAVEGLTETILRVLLFWVVVAGVGWISGALTLVAWPLGTGAVLLVDHKLLRNWEETHRRAIFEDRRFWGRHRYYTRPLRIA